MVINVKVFPNRKLLKKKIFPHLWLMTCLITVLIFKITHSRTNKTEVQTVMIQDSYYVNH